MAHRLINGRRDGGREKVTLLIRRKRRNTGSAGVGVRSESSDRTGSFDTDSNSDSRLEANEERLYHRRRARLRSHYSAQVFL